MKRFVSLACIAMVLVMCLVSPVSASEINPFFDVLTYSMPNGGNSTQIYGQGSIAGYFKLPYSNSITYVDMLLVADDLDSVRFGGPALSFDLNIIHIQDNFYRVFGDVNYYSDDFYVYVSGDSLSYVTFSSFKVSLGTFFYKDIECYCQIVANDYDKTIHYVPTDEINYRIFQGASDFSLAQYTLNLWCDEWRTYDYIDFLIVSTVDSITSISSTFNGAVVPTDYSFIDNDSMTMNGFCYSIRIDLTGIDKSIDDYPLIMVNGNVSTDQLNSVGVLSCVGIIQGDVPNVTYSWLKDIYNAINSGFTSLTSNISSYFSSWFLALDSWIETQSTLIHNHFLSLDLWIESQTQSISSDFSVWFIRLDTWIESQTSILESAIRGDTSPGNSFQQQVDQKDQQLEDMSSVMESVDQPDLNSVNVSANTYVDGTVLAASMSGITSVFSQGLFFDMIVMSIMMATAGYVLFGKR